MSDKHLDEARKRVRAFLMGDLDRGESLGVEALIDSDPTWTVAYEIERENLGISVPASADRSAPIVKKKLSVLRFLFYFIGLGTPVLLVGGCGLIMIVPFGMADD